MSIPKTIHYCWFGKGKMPAISERCLESWRKFCPDYNIVCWTEDNFDITQNRYMYEAYQAGKWAFVSDYARLKVLHEEGGIYLDTDVELIKPLDDLIADCGFMGYDDNGLIATGLGFACEKGNELVAAILADYADIPFVLPDGSYDLTPCPQRNTATLQKLGMNLSKQDQIFIGIRMLPEDYLCPMKYYTGKKVITKNTHSIHHYCATWISPTAKRTLFVKRIIGIKLYNKLYGKFLHKFKWLEW